MTGFYIYDNGEPVEAQRGDAPTHALVSLERIDELLELGSTLAAPHKQWALDQIAREVYGDRYEVGFTRHCDGEDGPETYECDEGIAP